MTYLKKEISKKLSDKGIVSGSVTYGLVSIKDYTVWDLIGNKENARKLFGNSKWHYKFIVHNILDLVHEHGENSEEVIKEIEKVL